MYNFLEISLSNLVQNYCFIKSILYKKVSCSIIIKSNAYGLGLIQVSKILFSQGCRNFWVNDIEEGIAIKQHVDNSNIYVLSSNLNIKEIQIIKKMDFIFVITEIKQINLISICKNYNIKIVINFDTGLGREGLQIQDFKQIRWDQFNTKFIMSHLSAGGVKNYYINRLQFRQFKYIKQYFYRINISFSNSSGMLLNGKYRLGIIRIGGLLYGINIPYKLEQYLNTVIKFYASIQSKKVLNRNSYIGYNNNFFRKRNNKILIINVGYYNGYPTNMINKGVIFTEGFYAPIIGKISMNYIIVDATYIPINVFVSLKYVELIGKNITLDKISRMSNSNPRELLVSLSRNNKVVYN